MPIYEYECQKCGGRLERIQKFSDPILTECPKCKGRLKKLISNTSFVLKGTGWYVTDYARKDSGGNGKKEKPAEKAAKPGAEPKKQAKSEKTEKSGKKPKKEAEKKTKPSKSA